MISVSLKSALVAFCALFLLHCKPAQTAYFARHSSLQPVQDELLDSDRTTAIDSMSAPAEAVSQMVSPPPGLTAAVSPHTRHANPDAQSPTRRHFWLKQSRLFVPTGDTYVAPRYVPDRSAKRTVPKGAVYALAGGALPYSLLLIGSLPTWAWLLSLALPVTSMFMAMGALAKVRSNREKYKGKGIAVAALLLATSYMGMVLYAVAALSASGVLWE